ncbi:hypothetical protein ACFL3A_12540, partial [Pseudomonadota bacterium]
HSIFLDKDKVLRSPIEPTVMNLPFVDFQRMAGVGRTRKYRNPASAGFSCMVNGNFRQKQTFAYRF